VKGLRERVGRLEPIVADGLLALALLVEIELEAWLDTVVPASHRPITAVAAVLYVAPVVFRRRWPGAALVGCAAVAAVQASLAGNILEGTTGTLLPPLILAYTAGSRLELRWGLRVLAIAGMLLGVGVVVSGAVPEPHKDGSLSADLIGACMLPAVLWLIGRLARERARRTAAFAELAVRVEHEREDRERAAVIHERFRIGHELQDIVAQNVSAIIIQAGGVRQLIASDPPGARDAILTVELAAREALADLRRTLGLLRTDDDPRALAPQPGLAQLGTLLRSVQERGLACELLRRGESAQPATGIDLLGYRVIEAALRAAVEHGSQRAQITVGHASTRLELEVRGDRMITNLEEELSALSERIALYDGTLRVLPADEAGFALQALLPLRVPA
jgi:signal transduction histidine kinase